MNMTYLLVKKLALSGKFTNAQVCTLAGVTEVEFDQIMEEIVCKDRDIQRLVEAIEALAAAASAEPSHA